MPPMQKNLSAREVADMRRACQSVVEYLYERFAAKFVTDEDCWTELYRNTDSFSFKCKYCGVSPTATDFSQRATECSGCKKKVWYSAGSFFQHIRKVKAWLAAIWLMERGIVLTSSFFHRLVGISQSSALYVIKKLRMVVTINSDIDSPTVSSKCLQDAVGKRSLETPARIGPGAEEEILEAELRAKSEAAAAKAKYEREQQEKAENERKQRSTKKQQPGQKSAVKPASASTSAQGLTGLAKKAFKLISDIPISFDNLCGLLKTEAGKLSAALTVLSVMDLVDQLPGDKYIRLSDQQREDRTQRQNGPSYFQKQNKFALSRFSPKATTLFKTLAVDEQFIREFLEFSYLHFIGVSRKHLQLYASEFWCHRVRDRWGVEKLREACFKSEPIRDLEILSYVTPPLVKMFALNE